MRAILTAIFPKRAGLLWATAWACFYGVLCQEGACKPCGEISGQSSLCFPKKSPQAWSKNPPSWEASSGTPKPCAAPVLQGLFLRPDEKTWMVWLDGEPLTPEHPTSAQGWRVIEVTPQGVTVLRQGITLQVLCHA